jgi:hypothetical protein
MVDTVLIFLMLIIFGITIKLPLLEATFTMANACQIHFHITSACEYASTTRTMVNDIKNNLKAFHIIALVTFKLSKTYI